MKTIYLDNAVSLSLKRNPGERIPFLKKGKPKTHALSGGKK